MFSSLTGPYCAVSFQFLLMYEVCSVFLNSEGPEPRHESTKDYDLIKNELFKQFVLLMVTVTVPLVLPRLGNLR